MAAAAAAADAAATTAAAAVAAAADAAAPAASAAGRPFHDRLLFVRWTDGRTDGQADGSADVCEYPRWVDMCVYVSAWGGRVSACMCTESTCARPFEAEVTGLRI